MVNAQTISQDTLIKRYEAETIYLWGSNKYIKDNKKLKVGFLGRKIEKEFELFPEAYKEFNDYKSKTKTGLILLGIGYAALVSSQYTINPGDANINPAFYAFSAGGLALMGTSIIYTFKGYNHYQKAIWLRNREALSK